MIDNGTNTDRRDNMLTEELTKLLEQSEDIEAFAREYGDFYSDQSFKEFLEQLMAKNALKKSEVIRASGLGESFAYQIFAGNKRPSRDKLLALAIGMRLTPDECQRLLRLAGASGMYVKNRRDSIIMFGLQKGLGLTQINDVLFDMDEPVL